MPTLREKFEYSFPERGCSEHSVSKYALTYQPMSCVLWNFSVISGIATVMIAISKAIRKHARLSPRMRRCSFAPDMKWSSSSSIVSAGLPLDISTDDSSRVASSFSCGGICSFVEASMTKGR